MSGTSTPAPGRPATARSGPAPAQRTSALAAAVAGLDVWLETMRGPHGYTGPIAHWWESNFVYTGALYDWRYEGIIDGYRTLFLRTGDARFLDKAVRAADEVVRAQLPDGRFRRSSFQFGPVRGGTPHEAAIDAALLALARTLEDAGRDGEPYRAAAEANLDGYFLERLWNGRGFQDQPYASVLVANKHGTLLEAWLLSANVSGRNVDEFAAACVEAVRRAVVREGPAAGGTVHLGIGPSRLAIPIYTARAMNGIVSYHEASGDRSVLPMLAAAGEFLARSLTPHGVVWGVYGDGRPCPNPRILAGAGDVLRFLTRLGDLDLAPTAEPVERTTEILLRSQRPGGALPTGLGFARKGMGPPEDRREFRDELPVVGWVDKSFRALAALLPDRAAVPSARPGDHEADVLWRGRTLRYRETPDRIELRAATGGPVYLWRKGQRAPDVVEL